MGLAAFRHLELLQLADGYLAQSGKLLHTSLKSWVMVSIGFRFPIDFNWLYGAGYRLRAGSGSPVRRRDADRRYSSDFDNSGPHLEVVILAMGGSSFRDSSPPYARGRGGGRPLGRGFDGPGFGPGPLRGEGMSRNNPNMWQPELCKERTCGEVLGGAIPAPPPPHAPPRRFPGPPLDLSPGRTMNGYRSPPRGWSRDGPRDFGPGGPPPPSKEAGFLTMICGGIGLIIQMMSTGGGTNLIGLCQ
ncbi:LOW QUALITY PROTEIN: hypothetical protein NC652_016874 [Populus alba x Populus x berolinensis]|nr:LOW QUALITY PROTEIN: hypothetical protein NC652_016874 [Populus alba x Populus x berolinensis]